MHRFAPGLTRTGVHHYIANLPELTAAAVLQLVEQGKVEAVETTLGWHRGQLAGTPYFGKPGGGPGFQSNLRVYPLRGLATVWLANQTSISEGPINRLTDALDRHFLV